MSLKESLHVMAVLICTAAIFTAVSMALGQSPPVPSPAGAVPDVPDQTAPPTSDARSSSATPEKQADDQPMLSEEQAADVEAIRQLDLQLIKAYEAGDARAVTALFTDDAEFVDEQGNVFHGKKAIEETMSRFFEQNPGCQLDLEIESIRFLAPGVAVEEGTAAMIRTDQSMPVETHYTSVHVKTDGQWRTASIRDHKPRGRSEHREQLQQLAWLIGDWVDEEEDMCVMFSCEPVDGGNFLLRKFTVHIGGQETITGTQRIGWDPLSGTLKSWVFDSKGGFAEGVWHQDGESWVLNSTGVTADGQHASGLSIYTPVGTNAMIWQLVNHEVGGVRQPDSEPLTIVRRAEAPGTRKDQPAADSK